MFTDLDQLIILIFWFSIVFLVQFDQTDQTTRTWNGRLIIGAGLGRVECKTTMQQMRRSFSWSQDWILISNQGIQDCSRLVSFPVLIGTYLFFFVRNCKEYWRHARQLLNWVFLKSSRDLIKETWSGQVKYYSNASTCFSLLKSIVSEMATHLIYPLIADGPDFTLSWSWMDLSVFVIWISLVIIFITSLIIEKYGTAIHMLIYPLIAELLCWVVLKSASHMDLSPQTAFQPPLNQIIPSHSQRGLYHAITVMMPSLMDTEHLHVTWKKETLYFLFNLTSDSDTVPQSPKSFERWKTRGWEDAGYGLLGEQ